MFLFLSLVFPGYNGGEQSPPVSGFQQQPQLSPRSQPPQSDFWTRGEQLLISIATSDNPSNQ